MFVLTKRDLLGGQPGSGIREITTRPSDFPSQATFQFNRESMEVEKD